MSNVFQTCLKCFKLKKLVVKPKTAQPIEPDEELVDPQLNQSGLGRPLAQSVKVQVNPQLNRSRVQKTFSFF